jgi:hypothetical protein
MRSLLCIGDMVDRNAVFGARRSTTTAIVVTGVRCIITYLLIPVLVPFVGLIDAVDAPLSLALTSLAVVMAIVGLRRFWIADHQARWAYTAFIALVLAFLLVTIVVDVSSIVAA